MRKGNPAIGETEDLSTAVVTVVWEETRQKRRGGFIDTITEDVSVRLPVGRALRVAQRTLDATRDACTSGYVISLIMGLGGLLDAEEGADISSELNKVSSALEGLTSVYPREGGQWVPYCGPEFYDLGGTLAKVLSPKSATAQGAELWDLLLEEVFQKEIPPIVGRIMRIVPPGARGWCSTIADPNGLITAEELLGELPWNTGAWGPKAAETLRKECSEMGDDVEVELRGDPAPDVVLAVFFRRDVHLVRENVKSVVLPKEE